MSEHNNPTAVIIGGGLGGLFTGAILAHEGLNVTVLEKNTTVGGGLQSFHRFGCTFDTGMHVIGGMQPGGNIRRICQYLGILDEMRLKNVDPDCTDELYFLEDHHCYRIAQGEQGFINALARDFPDSRAELEHYVRDIMRITHDIALFNLRPSEDYIAAMPEDSMLSATDFIARHVSNRRLRSVLAYMNPLYGGQGGVTPAYIHAIISALYIHGASRFVGGSSRFADVLTNVITRHGGRVLTHDSVRHITIKERKVESVTTEHGEVYTADYYISDVHPCTLIRLMDGQGFTKAYRTRLEEIPNTYSAFSVYLKLKPASFPYINHSIYLMTRYDDIWNFADPSKTWPLGLLMMTPPVDNQGPWASTVLLTVPMTFDKVKAWEDTVTGKRGQAYEQWKKTCARRVLDLVEMVYPGFSGKIEAMNTASPLTIRDYYGSKDGTLSGYSKDCHNLALTNIPVVTKVSNLLLTGQNINLHGFCGVPLTAINTSEAILGRNVVINHINACGKD